MKDCIKGIRGKITAKIPCEFKLEGEKVQIVISNDNNWEITDIQG